MGSGKTLLETKMILDTKQQVLANYAIYEDDEKTKKHPNVKDLEIGELLHLPYEKCYVVLDEAYAYLESRVSMSKLNLYMSYILFQSRKRGITFILTAQLANSLDNRFLNLADIIIVANQVKDGFMYVITNGRVFRKILMNWKQAEKIWNKYDTSQVILPPQIQDLETQVQILDKKKLKQKIDELEEKFKQEYPDIKKISHALVDGFLVDLEESDVYSSYLYARLQKLTLCK